MALLALRAGKINQSLIRNRFYKAVAQKIQRDAQRANCLRLRHALLDLGVGESPLRADGAVVDQRTARYDFRSARDGNIGVLETPVRMERLKKAFEPLGFRNVKTLLASGNVLFEAPGRNASALAQKIEKRLRETFGHEIGTIVRTRDELQNLTGANPFKGIAVTPRTRLFVTFLSAKRKTSLKVPYVSPDKSFRILRLTDGEVCSVLVPGRQWARNLRQMDILEKEFGKKITTRNWNTVVRVLKAST